MIDMELLTALERWADGLYLACHNAAQLADEDGETGEFAGVLAWHASALRGLLAGRLDAERARLAAAEREEADARAMLTRFEAALGEGETSA